MATTRAPKIPVTNEPVAGAGISARAKALAGRNRPLITPIFTESLGAGYSERRPAGGRRGHRRREVHRALARLGDRRGIVRAAESRETSEPATRLNDRVQTSGRVRGREATRDRRRPGLEEWRRGRA